MIKNQAGQKIGAQMISATDGSNFSGTVTVYVTGDAGTQAIGSVGSGVCTLEGQGYYTYAPAQAETNYDLIAFTFVGSGAISVTIQVATILAAAQAAIQGSTTAGSISAAQLIAGALMDLGVVAAGETLSAEDSALGLIRLNDLIDAWAAQRLTIYTVTRTTWTITANDGTYTVGTGGDVNVARPVFVNQVNFLDTTPNPDQEYLLNLLTDDAYASIGQKALTSTYPTCVYYNPTYSAGLGTLNFWPVPTSSTLQGVLYAPQATGLVGLSDTISLPPGYRRALRSNLAVELCDAFEKPVTPTLAQRAAESLGTIKRANERLSDLSLDLAVLPPRRMWNIYTGSY